MSKVDAEWTIFGERLSKELEKKQLSYRQFAEMVGMTTTTVFRYAKCERVPRATEIKKIADVLGITCDYLLGLSDDPHKTSMSYVIAQPERKYIKDDIGADVYTTRVQPERVEGEWIPIYRKRTGKVIAQRCSQCLRSPKYGVKSDFCPNCGSYNGGEKSKGDN